MKRMGLTGVYEFGLLVILFGVVLHAPLTVALGSFFPEHAALIKAWKEILLALLGVIAIALITKQRLWKHLSRDRLMQLSVGFISLHLLLALVFGGYLSAIGAGLLIDLRFIAMFMLTYVLMLIRPEAFDRVIKVLIAGGIVVLGFGLLQLSVLPDDVLRYIGYSKQTIAPFITIDSNSDFVRINSTLRGPNPLGALTVVYITLSLAYLLRNPTMASVTRKWQIIAASVIGVAVLFASYSRSAYVALLAAMVGVVASMKRLSRRAALIVAGVAVTTGVALLLVSSSDWFSNVILHEDPESSVVSKSNDGHVESLINGANRVIAQPFGAGIGSTGSASLYDDDVTNDFIIENNYFFIAHESGWLGLVLFLALLGTVLIALWRRQSHWLTLGVFASGIGLSVIGILLPVWVDETVALIWWGLAGAGIAHKRYNEE